MSASIHPALLQARRQQQSSKQSKMSITQTFYLAHKARSKLSSEASKSDHDLRLLVGHANLLDRLMLHLQTAEREQDAWFNAMVRGNSTEEDESDIMDTISEEDEEEHIGSLAEDYPASESSDDESEDDYELESNHIVSVPRYPAYDYSKTVIDVDEVDADEDFEEEEDGFYALRRTSSHAPMSPPELIEDDESDSESLPPSPPQPTLAEPIFYQSKNKKQIDGTGFYNTTTTLVESTYYSSSNIIPAF
ncbi:hypothetical protein TWF788_005896 [Orbilia oligospora]|uniref:Uncharacterized protein n=1 Tax=Orbilia oligospora TaxID=2813651 RepID=A0A6G1M4A5_ORBOL|nr:hypothetical protein TWF788_005896 [Orbilia oligospora]KAF3196499.1 hypothetical protein TWF679_005076 [Orbilia oligospora]KAF3202495.1 hypothetical protein TWF191_002944 [Orbilia oligospora]KAF3245087.1 hypothetical protein TWF192_007606 [Orbilia oligospora]